MTLKGICSYRYHLIVAIMLGCTTVTEAQLAKSDPLYREMVILDSSFFERSFNSCDTAFARSATAKELVFYHDRSGVQDQELFLQNIAKYLCGDANNKPIRKLRRQSFEVYPLYNNNILYGAVHMGVHDFYIRSANNPDRLTGSAKFTHVFILQEGRWLLKEVLSFDHK